MAGVNCCLDSLHILLYSLAYHSTCCIAGLDDEKAGSMAVAVVAARLRGILVDAAACQRQNSDFEVLDKLMRVGSILDKFPLPQQSPQADMIATAVQQRATLPERQVTSCVHWETVMQW